MYLRRPFFLYPPAVMFTSSLRLSSIVIHLFFEPRIVSYPYYRPLVYELPSPLFFGFTECSFSFSASNFRPIRGSSLFHLFIPVFCLPSFVSSLSLFRLSSASHRLFNLLRFISSRNHADSSAFMTISTFLRFLQSSCAPLSFYVLHLQRFTYTGASF